MSKGRSGKAAAFPASVWESRDWRLDAEDEEEPQGPPPPPPPTQEEIDAIKEAARREGLQAGHAEGLEQGRQEAIAAFLERAEERMAETLAPLQILSSAFNEDMLALTESVGESLTKVAIKAAESLVREHLIVKPDAVLALVQEMMHEEPSLVKKPKIWLHPEDADIVRRHLGEQLEEIGWSVVTDASLTRGGCKLLAGDGSWDGTVEERLQVMKDDFEGLV